MNNVLWQYPWVFDPNLIYCEKDLFLIKDAYLHVCTVLRCKNNDTLVVFDGKGNLRLGTLILKSKEAYIHFDSDFEKMPAVSYQYNLIQFLPNNVATFEIILRKCCELGVNTLYTVLGERSERKQWSEFFWNKRSDRFQRILIESCKQSKNPYLPKISQPVTLQELDFKNLGCCFHGSLREDLNVNIQEKGGSVYSVMVGPEGGFSDSEEEFLNSFSSRIHLPTYVLRVETAVVSLMTAIKIRANFCEK